MAGDFSNVYLALCTERRSSGVLLLVLLESGLTGVYASRYTIDEYVGVLLVCGDSECDVCVAHINHVRVGNAAVLQLCNAWTLFVVRVNPSLDPVIPAHQQRSSDR